ncbi:Helix-turn-helix transcriptional regulator [Candidatus Hepatincolaceae symbiont of Richtersius coronifer]
MSYRNQSVNNNLKLLREEQNLTMRELAEKAGISQGHLANLELGKRRLNETNIRQLASALGVMASKIIKDHSNSSIFNPPSLDIDLDTYLKETAMKLYNIQEIAYLQITSTNNVSPKIAVGDILHCERTRKLGEGIFLIEFMAREVVKKITFKTKSLITLYSDEASTDLGSDDIELIAEVKGVFKKL